MKVRKEAAEKAENDKENVSGNADILGGEEDADVIF